MTRKAQGELRVLVDGRRTWGRRSFGACNRAQHLPLPNCSASLTLVVDGGDDLGHHSVPITPTVKFHARDCQCLTVGGRKQERTTPHASSYSLKSPEHGRIFEALSLWKFPLFSPQTDTLSPRQLPPVAPPSHAY